jgi:tRNA (guanine-N7-)-methyltransferase
VGKNKVARWTEMKSFSNVIEPDVIALKKGDHPLKGRWKRSHFGNDNPLVIELGCGKGEYTLGLALKYPGKNFIGIDIKGARIWRGAKTAHDNSVSNVLFLRTRIEFINSFFDENEVDEIWITFPDPFPRAKNEGRRLTSPSFLNLYRTILAENGTIHLKTDNHPLYRYTLDTAIFNNLAIISQTEDLYSGDNRDEILSIRTHYESIFLKEGKKINYLSFHLPKNRNIANANPAKKLQ